MKTIVIINKESEFTSLRIGILFLSGRTEIEITFSNNESISISISTKTAKALCDAFKNQVML